MQRLGKVELTVLDHENRKGYIENKADLFTFSINYQN